MVQVTFVVLPGGIGVAVNVAGIVASVQPKAAASGILVQVALWGDGTFRPVTFKAANTACVYAFASAKQALTAAR